MGNIINCTCRMIMSCCRLNHCYTIFPCKCQPPLPRGNRPQMAHRAKSCSSSFILSSCGLIFARPLYTFCCGLSEALHPGLHLLGLLKRCLRVFWDPTKRTAIVPNDLGSSWSCSFCGPLKMNSHCQNSIVHQPLVK